MKRLFSVLSIIIMPFLGGMVMEYLQSAHAENPLTHTDNLESWLASEEGQHLQKLLVLCDHALVGDYGIRSTDYVSGSAGFAIYKDPVYGQWIIEVDGWISRPKLSVAKDWSCFTVEGAHIMLQNPVQFTFVNGQQWNNQNLLLAYWEVQ